MGLQRIQKVISRYGYASRRKAEQLIREGRVKVDGSVIRGVGEKVEEDATIEIDGRVINREKRELYLLMNKPRGYICSRQDPRGRPLIYDLLPERYREEGVYSIGRLDRDSEGLLLLTNDGDFAHRIGHPSSGVVKKYLVETSRDIPYNLIESWKNGVYINGEKYTISSYRRINARKIEISLVEGKNREIRRLFRDVSCPVTSLRRVSLGFLTIMDTPRGGLRELTDEETGRLRARAGSKEAKTRPIIIAIDGPAGSGKSTVARRIARDLGITYLDTGAMYRAFTYFLLKSDIPLENHVDIRALLDDFSLDMKGDRVLVNGEDVTGKIRTREVTENVSYVSSLGFVREKMVELQRNMGKNTDLVAEGRDIGTVVFTDTPHKFYLDAEVGERARRRLHDDKSAENFSSIHAVRDELLRRDAFDSSREISPLKKAEDAVLIDTTHLTVDDVCDTIISRVKEE